MQNEDTHHRAQTVNRNGYGNQRMMPQPNFMQYSNTTAENVQIQSVANIEDRGGAQSQHKRSNENNQIENKQKKISHTYSNKNEPQKPTRKRHYGISQQFESEKQYESEKPSPEKKTM